MNAPDAPAPPTAPAVPPHPPTSPGVAGDRPEWLVPPRVVATPIELPPSPMDALTPEHATPFDADVTFWRPRAHDVARVLGWRWFLLVPLLATIVFIPAAAVYAPHTIASLWQIEIKVLVFAVAAAISIVLWGVRNVVKARKDAFCIHCGYTVEGLEDTGLCPECGRGYAAKVCEEFKRDPHFFVHRYHAARQVKAGPGFAAGNGPTPDDGTR